MTERDTSPTKDGGWWLSNQGTQTGPHSEAFLLVGLKTGTISPQTNGCPVGGTEWKRLCDWPALAGACPAAPPPLPRPDDLVSGEGMGQGGPPVVICDYDEDLFPRAALQKPGMAGNRTRVLAICLAAVVLCLGVWATKVVVDKLASGEVNTPGEPGGGSPGARNLAGTWSGTCTVQGPGAPIIFTANMQIRADGNYTLIYEAFDALGNANRWLPMKGRTPIDQMLWISVDQFSYPTQSIMFNGTIIHCRMIMTRVSRGE